MIDIKFNFKQPIFQILHYLSFVRIEQSLFTLPFIIISILSVHAEFPAINNKSPYSILIYIKIISCFILLRAAAMSFNRLVDIHIDASNPRTKNRDLPQGKISTTKTALVTLVLSLSFLLIAYSINLLCLIGGMFVLALSLSYSYTKRWTVMCHFILGFTIGLTPIAVYIAMTNSISLTSVLWATGFFGYISGFDLLYATLDQSFDNEKKLFSIPARFGNRFAMNLAGVFYLLSMSAFFITGWLSQLHVMYYMIIGFAISWTFWQQIRFCQSKNEKLLSNRHIILGQMILLAYLIGRY